MWYTGMFCNRNGMVDIFRYDTTFRPACCTNVPWYNIPPPHTHTLAFEFNKALMADSGTKLNIFSPGVSWAPKLFFPGS